jgi:hypothetical protein
MRLTEKMKEQKLDLLIAKDSNDPFIKMALDNGVKLQ